MPLGGVKLGAAGGPSIVRVKTLVSVPITSVSMVRVAVTWKVKVPYSVGVPSMENQLP